MCLRSIAVDPDLPPSNQVMRKCLLGALSLTSDQDIDQTAFRLQSEGFICESEAGALDCRLKSLQRLWAIDYSGYLQFDSDVTLKMKEKKLVFLSVTQATSSSRDNQTVTRSTGNLI
jgi:hypothetical protein